MPSSAAKRREIAASYANAVAWSLGNGLVSTTLVVYLALGLGADSLLIAWLLAAPRFAGVLRVAAPSLLSIGAACSVSRKPICLTAFALSAATLAAVPAVTWGVSPETSQSELATRLLVLAIGWCLYHLLQYVAVVALWSWFGDLYPPQLRSRIVGQRERWLALGSIAGTLTSIALAFAWSIWSPDQTNRVPLAISATAGASLMLAALVPLLSIRSLADRPSALPTAPWLTLRQAITEPRYRRLLAFNCWLGFANGITGSAQSLYGLSVLGIPFATLQTYRIAMEGGQSLLADWSGRAISRWGAKRVMAPAQAIVATGPLWYFLATPETAWLVGVAFLAWVAYAPINVALDTLKLDLAEPANNAPYLAVFHAVSDFANGITVLLGGLLFDTLTNGDAFSLRVYAGLFLTGWIARTVGVVFVARLIEPKNTARSS